MPVVEFLNGRVEPILPRAFIQDVRGQGQHVRVQVPLMLAWVLTVHKSQVRLHCSCFYSLLPSTLPCRELHHCRSVLVLGRLAVSAMGQWPVARCGPKPSAAVLKIVYNQAGGVLKTSKLL